MKIIVDFVRARQEWDPDTGKQYNFVVFKVAGKEFSFPVDEDELARMVRYSQEDQAPTEDVVDPQLGSEEWESPMGSGSVQGESETMEFLEQMQSEEPPRLNFVDDEAPRVEPPQIFGLDTDDMEDDDMPAPVARELTDVQKRLKGIRDRRRKVSPAYVDRRERIEAMRANAAAVPTRRVAADDQGNPVVPQTAHTPQTRDPSSLAYGAPEVIRHNQPSAAELDDDDGFAQG